MSNQSESIINLMTALSKFQENCPTVPKTKKNPHLKNMYAGLEDIMGTIRKPLREAGLVVSQLPGDNTLTTLLAHFESGEFVKSTITLKPAKDNNPQAVGSALTYARRYTLSAVLGLPIGEDDDDGHQASAKPKPAKSGKEKMHPGHAMWKACVLKLAKNEADLKKVKQHYDLSETDAGKMLDESVAMDLKQTAQ